MSTPFASIGGLGSGLDTANIVQQLLALERQPIQGLQRRQADQRRANDAWGSVVQRLSTLRNTVRSLEGPTWRAKLNAASSTNEAVARVSATGSAEPGSLSFRVEQLASAQRSTLGVGATGPDELVGAQSVVIHLASGPIELELSGTDTLADAASRLQAIDGLSARVLRTADGRWELVVASDRTGSAAGFGVSGDGSLGTQQVRVPALDARITMGTLVIERADNTVDELFDGLSIHLTGLGEVTVEVRQDLQAAVQRVRAFVDGLNGVLGQLGTVGKVAGDQAARGPLAGDPLVRSLTIQLRSALSQVAGGGAFPTAASIGLSVGRDGTVAVDEARLRDALQQDPGGVAQLLGTGGADAGGEAATGSLAQVFDRLLTSTEGRSGSITRAREAIDGRIRAANDTITRFEQRLEIRERTIRRQFTGLESAMARFGAQASWLSSQLASMTPR
jgi:flagellar hook-associated protein 2